MEEVTEDIITEKETLLQKPFKTFLEKGDFFPFIKIGNKELYNFTDNKKFIFLCINNRNLLEPNHIEILLALHKEFHLFIYYLTGESKNNVVRYTQEPQLQYLLEIPSHLMRFYIMSPNRRILDIIDCQTFGDLFIEKISRYNIKSHIPYLLVEDVLNPELLNKVIKYYKDNVDKAIIHNSSGKNRLHVHPNLELEKEIDNRLSRSLFPEIKKVFYFDVNNRESYKISSYDAVTSGRFHSHRDTPKPHQHRRYAMSLLLNDDYEGGDLYLAEYGISIKPKKNCAFIFPGIYSHQVKQITKGSRMCMISFFTTKSSTRYQVKSNFFKEHQIVMSPIYPISQISAEKDKITATTSIVPVKINKGGKKQS